MNIAQITYALAAWVVVMGPAALAQTTSPTTLPDDAAGARPRANEKADQEAWKGVGCVGGVDLITQIHITNLLLSHDIKSIMEGSVVYGISVPRAKGEEALQLLRTDAAKRGYWLGLGKDDVVKAVEPKQRVSRSAVSTVLQMPEYASETALGRFLRSKDISQLTAKYPYIVSLSVHERQYLATPKTYGTGYDVQLELQTSAGEREDGYRGWYQVYDGGNTVTLLGANAWTFDAK